MTRREGWSFYFRCCCHYYYHYKIAFCYYQFNDETGVTHSVVIYCQAYSSAAKHLSGMYKSLDLFPVQKNISNTYSKQRLGCSSVEEHLPSKNKTLGSLTPQGGKDQGKND